LDETAALAWRYGDCIEAGVGEGVGCDPVVGAGRAAAGDGGRRPG
jgi:hypothetical protein